MKRINLKDIKPYQYEGYIWMSDQRYPIIFNGADAISLPERDNAFIAEGFLWHPDTRTSIRITYHDGKQHVYETIISPEELQGCEYTSVETYISHRITGVTRLSFVRFWNLQSEELCEGFEVYTPQALVFTGFIKNE